jgi:hypothetical protein
MFLLKQSTAIDLCFFAHDINGDPVTGKVNGDWTKRISKNSAAFGAMTVTITELENGWYALPITTSHSDTLGLLTMTFTATGVKQVNLQYRITARLTDDIPTAIENADGLLKRDWTSVTGEAARSVLNALRTLRNKWSISGTTLTVTKEDDSTTAYTSALTTAAGADSITASDPS